MIMLRSIGINFAKASPYLRTVRFNSTGSQALNWVEYLALKKQGRRINVTASVLTGLAGAGLTLNGLANIEIDPEKPIMGFDPLYVLIGGIMLGGFVGYLVGPVIGTPLFNLKNRAVLHEYKIKDKIFLERIKQNRVNPTSQSLANPVPDYYGERIYSLKDYRQWLRDCNAFRRKSREFL
ncbi:Piso0_005415 [Millerozyma farinosa CBS 7064]|uniref:Presequence translocated-associated motor subunit PAM17 n=1 Tax=Pichia sorbitophila (strain ATCC MYA-4447 / BCRC 22081 / CBS 7064 / NBRC 10061 / NRRL Y-12695) TaxID=559304 RepID=G8XYY8_PICSO|nr:Piso0_005415 [Millerozyma farinosa CBS 7064]